MGVKRRFVMVGNRRVHYWRAGEGPPCVLIHSSPANVRLLAKEVAYLAADWTVFAFDTPGFGLSDPLPGAELEVADLADALVPTLAALGMPPCPVYGTHTGAAIALELGVRHPDRVTGLVLDGVPAFTDDECERFFRDYFRVLPITDLGGHYAEAWTRFRDQSTWFPWSERRVDHLNPYDLSPPHSTHLWASMYFEAADHYAPAYRAASFYGARAIRAAERLTLPAIYTATTTDMLHPHLARLPAMKPGQTIGEIGDSYERKRMLIREGFARFGSLGAAPGDPVTIGSSAKIERQFVDGIAGQFHLRHCGDRAGLPLLLLHDAPGSSEQLEPLIEALAGSFFVIAPDLPGNGESDPFDEAPDVDRLAAWVVALLDTLAVERTLIHATGFGTSVALALALSAPDRVCGLAIRGVALPDVTERAALARALAPPIAIEPDGAHWYRTWLMLRDSQIYWPWYDRRLAALRRTEADFGARRLHRWTLDVMRSRATYHQLIDAALAHDAAGALTAIEPPILIVEDKTVPLSAYDDRLRALRPDAPVVPALDVAAALLALYRAVAGAGSASGASIVSSSR